MKLPDTRDHDDVPLSSLETIHGVHGHLETHVRNEANEDGS